MKIQVLYDSYFGNTEAIAMTIVSALSRKHNVKAIYIKKDNPDLDVDVFVIASPTRAFNMSEGFKTFFKKQSRLFEGKQILICDTRIDIAKEGNRLLRFLVKLFGYAADSIEKQAKKHKGIISTEPVGFFVGGVEGPLLDGELERAGEWVKENIHE